MIRILTLALIAGAAATSLADPKGDVKASFRGDAVKLSEAERRTMQGQLEALVGSCAAAHAPAPARRHADLELGVHYAKPKTLASADPARPELVLRDIVLDATQDVNEGRPLVYVVAERDAQQLDQCDPARLNAVLCVAALEHLTPLKVRESCRLTPR